MVEPISWSDIPGPGDFDFRDVYEDAVAHARDGDVLVEVGAFMGRSAAFLATAAKASGKRLRIKVVDKFIYPFAQAGALRSLLRQCGVLDVVEIIQADAVEAAARFPNASIAFVFLDADHGLAPTRAAISAWLPKVKTGGELAGHDYDPERYPEVVHAVNTGLPGARIQGRSFRFSVPARP